LLAGLIVLATAAAPRAQTAPPARSEEIARWRAPDPICVTTIGLDPEFNAFVARRVQAVAASVGAPLATSKPGKPCVPNVEIMFSAYPQALALKVFKRNEALMGDHIASEAPGLRKFEPPIKTWYLTGTRDHNGKLVVPSSWTFSHSNNTTIDSRLRIGLSSEFVNILVIADRNAVADHEIGPISDYMAMRVLTQRRSLASCAPQPSILDLISSNCRDQDKPKTLTLADLADLKALYAPPS
jgi:hypothetical protein